MIVETDPAEALVCDPDDWSVSVGLKVACNDFFHADSTRDRPAALLTKVAVKGAMDCALFWWEPTANFQGR